LTWTQKSFVALGVDWAMCKFHIHNIIQGNLKSTNVLLFSDFFPFVSDFGVLNVAQKSSSELKPKNANPYWFAPELFASPKCTESSDIYAFGILLLEILTQSTPFERKTGAEIGNILKDPNENIEIPLDLPPMLSCLIQACIRRSSSARPPFYQIFLRFKDHHAFFSGTYFIEIDKLLNSLKTSDSNPQQALHGPLPSLAEFANMFRPLANHEPLPLEKVFDSSSPDSTIRLQTQRNL
jgi:serine/threonine protein kinase